MSNFTSAATDVGEFISDLDGGIFDRKLSIALSESAAACIDNGKEGEVSIKFKLKKIPGTQQVHIQHQLKYVTPTADGKKSEEETRSTPMHVGKYGRLTLAPENQLAMLDRTGQVIAG